jgi:malate synthase
LSSLASPGRIEVHGLKDPRFSGVLTTSALEFVANLQVAFSKERRRLLTARETKQAMFDSGVLPDFLHETEGIRNSNWTVAEVPQDLVDRRVEITGPAGDAKMMVNALNSGASTYMADLEDSQSPTWTETIGAQLNLRDAIKGEIRHVTREGKVYVLDEKVATLIVRPRGLHLAEEHMTVGDESVSASLFDFGLFLYHNADSLKNRGTAPYFYIPKLESHLEARLWGEVCARAEEYLGLAKGTIKLTVLIETLTAAFEMDEILFELKERIVGLNCGRWDYIFSYIKKLRNHPGFMLPDRAQVTMDRAFLAAYVDLLIRTCHRRGAYAIGGMSAYIPVRNDELANELALQRVRADKEREARLGHDGTWVAHPGLVAVAREVFDEWMPGPNQMHILKEGATITKEDLLRPPGGCVTMEGVRTNVAVGLRYLTFWLDGRGAVPINGLMEDAATSEICRAQIWQWIRHGAHLDDGREVTPGLVIQVISTEASRLVATESDRELVRTAQGIFTALTVSKNLPEFLTLPGYAVLMQREGRV